MFNYFWIYEVPVDSNARLTRIAKRDENDEIEKEKLEASEIIDFTLTYFKIVIKNRFEVN